MARDKDRTKRLKEAMKQNIVRRKEAQTKDIADLQNKISDFVASANKPQIKPIKNQEHIKIAMVVSDLAAGGLAGIIIGLAISRFFNITGNIPTIVCFAAGIMGGFYNVVKQTCNTRSF